MQIRDPSALSDLDHEVGVDHTDHLAEVANILNRPENGIMLK